MTDICPICEKPSNTVKKRRRNTAYVEELDECNWLTACRRCQDRDDEYYEERWAEYYSGLL